MDKQLEPCPFCGGKAIVYPYNKSQFDVSCYEDNSKCPIWPSSRKIFDTEQEAIKAWNIRHG